ncbi:MAG: GTP 3',8-cyclase MoaA [Oscillospiraceae bacterium]|nr:GTP 3',8-cyclase MoaA [Oscillospiraceae bacterium]
MIDGFGRDISYLRLSVTDNCNLRCRYCMPEEGICKKRHDEMLTEEELVMAVEAAASLGFTKLRITGGEPLVKKNILSICRRCAAVEGIRELALTTNGILLPDLAEPLRKAGVQRLNISLDTLNPDKYRYMTRRGTLEQAVAGIEIALRTGFERIKLNAVLIGGFNDDEIPELAGLTLKYPLDVRFIELMPMGHDELSKGAYISAREVLRRLPELRPAEQDGGVARLYELPGALGKVGLISPLSEHFCGTCNRLRLTADGKLKPCLHSAAQFPVKGLTRCEMAEQIKAAIAAKPEWHGALSFECRSRETRHMNQIGG